MNQLEPRYPITVCLYENNETLVCDNEIELVNELEWFDSEDETENAVVVDSLGRKLVLKIAYLKVVTFTVKG